VQCAESLRVQAYFDGELESVSAAELERHLEHCAECRALLAGLEELRSHIRRDVPIERAAPALRARVARALDAEARTARRAARPGVRAWRTRPFWLGATGGLGTALAAALALVFVSAGAPQGLQDELVAAHVRSLMPAHLTDVISTDQHTVKPWFAGHADVSPAVADFAAQGYRLVGGRADYFNRQRAAVVVYQHGAHVINVFSWAAGSARYPASSTRSGYHLVFWTVGDLEYCAVSDAGWDELGRLAGLLRDLGARDARQTTP
jgi:anti-sigma factor RsiW